MYLIKFKGGNTLIRNIRNRADAEKQRVNYLNREMSIAVGLKEEDLEVVQYRASATVSPASGRGDWSFNRKESLV